MIPELFNKCQVPIKFMNLKKRNWAGCYEPRSDTIFLDNSYNEQLPICKTIVTVHEIMHATGASHRNMRMERLAQHFPKCYNDMEEIIVEIATMVAMRKLGILTRTSMTMPIPAITKLYKPGMYIPWREVTAAVTHFLAEGEDVSLDLRKVRMYLTEVLKMDIRETYVQKLQLVG